MIDKVYKIRKEVEIVVNRRLNLLNGDYFDLNEETDGLTNEIMDIIDSLQEEPVSDDLGDYINELSKQFPEVSFAKLSRIAVRVAKWQKEQMMVKAFDGEILEVEDNDCAICSHTHLELCIEPDTLEKNGFKDNDKVKVIIIKEELL